MRSSDSPESDRLPGWENEPASDDLFDPEVLEKIREVDKRIEREHEEKGRDSERQS